MTTIRRPAIEVQQGRYKLYLTSFTAKNFRKDYFSRVCELRIREEAGYQRTLDEDRIKDFTDDIIQSSEFDSTEDNPLGACFYPTSVFLTTEHDVEYDDEKREISFDTSICPFNVVDGQHRIRALVEACEKTTFSLDEFPMPVTLVTGISDLEQMLQFLIVNSEQKKVAKVVEQYIYAKLFPVEAFEDDPPYLPKQIKREVEKGLYRESLAIVSFLNTEAKSPWKGKVLMANEEEKDFDQITQAAFVSSVRSHIFSKNNPLPNDDVLITQRFLLNYWIAITELIFKDGSVESDSNVFKTVGVRFFHKICPYFAGKYVEHGRGNVRFIKGHFEEVFDNLKNFPHEEWREQFAKLMTREFWKSGGEASKMNRAAIDEMVKYFMLGIDATAPIGDDNPLDILRET